MKRIKINENQFNMLFERIIVFENLDERTFLFANDVSETLLYETRGVPNSINVVTSSLLSRIKDKINNEVFNETLEIGGLFDGWSITFTASRDFYGMNGVTQEYKKNVEIAFNIDENNNFDECNVSNLIGHELMHVFQYYVGSNSIMKNKTKSEMYEIMNDVFNLYSNNKIICSLNYIIYYSFIEEQEAYTVGGKEYFNNFDDKKIIDYDSYYSFISSSPFYLAFQRLKEGKEILENYRLYKDIIDWFCSLYKIKYEDFVKVLNNSIFSLKYKFKRVLADFFIDNDISADDRKKFMFI